MSIRESSFTVRPALSADTDAILAINREGRPGVGPLERADVETFLDRAGCFRVAVRDRAAVAYLIALDAGCDYAGEEFLWFSDRYADFVYVDQIAVAGPQRGRGAAAALYDELETYAAGRGALRLTLEVNLRPENAPSIRFHERRGFREVGRLETADGRLVSLRMRELGRT